MNKSKTKPPVGVMCSDLYYELFQETINLLGGIDLEWFRGERIKQLKEAVERYKHSNQRYPEQWQKEIDVLISEIGSF